MEKEIIYYAIPELSFHIHALVLGPQRHTRGLHRHRAVELVRALEGEIVCLVEQTEIHLKAGHTLLINANAIHQLISSTPVQVTYIQLDLSKYTNILSSHNTDYLDSFLSMLQGKPYALEPSDTELSRLFDNMVAEISQKLPGYEIYLRSMILHLIAYMQRNALSSGYEKRVDSDMRKIMPAIDYINANYENKIFLETLACLCGRNKHSLCTIFKRVTGATVVDYINFVRLSKAESLLASGQINITETALACGFNSVQYFNRVFKKYMGCAPSEYKSRTVLKT